MQAEHRKWLMTNRILLINPWIYDFAAYDFWAEPLGFLYIAAVLRQAGYVLDYVDCLDRHHPGLLKRQQRQSAKSTPDGRGKYYKTVIEKPPLFRDVPRRYGRYGLPLDIFEQELAQLPRPEVILVTSQMTYWYPGVFEAIKRARARFPGVPVVLGGIYATLCYEHALANSGADYVLAGEAELAALALVNRLTRRADVPLPHYETLDDLPYPAHDLRRHLDFIVINTSRGCPMHCTYCASRLLHPQGFRQRQPRAVVEEIAYWRERYGVSDIVFYDDALLVCPEQHAHLILDELLQRKLSCRFHTPNGLHARMIDAALAGKMYAAGFKTVRVSLETINRTRQQQTSAKVTSEEVRQAIYYLREAGFAAQEIGVYALMGLPGQPLQEVAESIRFVHDCGAPVYLTIYSPIPGTEEYAHAVQSGQIVAKADPLLHNNSAYPMLRGYFSEEECQQVKALALDGNQRIAGEIETENG
jgi:radical SAM superfamily enzyme YgiQ (UPF0313 family)